MLKSIHRPPLPWIMSYFFSFLLPSTIKILVLEWDLKECLIELCLIFFWFIVKKSDFQNNIARWVWMKWYNLCYLAPKNNLWDVARAIGAPHRQRTQSLIQGKHRNVVDSDEEDDMIHQIRKDKQNQPQHVVPTPRKKVPVETDATPEKLMESM